MSDFLKCSAEIEALSSREVPMKSPQLVASSETWRLRREKETKEERFPERLLPPLAVGSWRGAWHISQDPRRGLVPPCCHQQLLSERLRSCFITTPRYDTGGESTCSHRCCCTCTLPRQSLFTVSEVCHLINSSRAVCSAVCSGVGGGGGDQWRRLSPPLQRGCNKKSMNG